MEKQPSEIDWFNPRSELRKKFGLQVLFNFESPWFSVVKCEDIWGFSSAGRAPALQAGGHRFDPGNLHHESKDSSQKKALSSRTKDMGL